MRNDATAAMLSASNGRLPKMLPSMPSLLKWFKPTMQQFAEQFADPFLRRAFSLFFYSTPDTPIFLHLDRHAYGISGNIQ